MALANTETNRNVDEFLEEVSNTQRKEDSLLLRRIIEEEKGSPAKIWGKSIVGFGKYSFKRKDGSEHQWFNVGFSPGKAHMTVYVMYDLKSEELLQDLGPHSTGRGCLYIKKLEDVNIEVLKQLIRKSDRWDHHR